MHNLTERFLDKENFYLAFKKLSFYLKQSNEWYNPVELAAYEANLATNIYKLTENLKGQNYTPHPIQPLPFPKKNNEKGEERLRQYFRIHLDDQIVWIALVNVIGSHLEKRMPFWSYGNRLFTPIWFEEDENKKTQIKRGSYHNSSGHLYRKWNQSWPFYRRHISMTIKTMAYNKAFTIEKLDDEIEKEIYIQNQENNWADYPYLNKDYWNVNETESLYWIGLDYKKFFPSVNPEKIVENIESALVRENGMPRDDRDLIISTIKRMLHFKIDRNGWENEGDLTDENKFNLKEGVTEFYGLPTGLLVSGFLANVGMIHVDAELNSWISNNRNLAIFKYVDDQVIIANTKETILDFLQFYDTILQESNTKVAFQESKIEPKGAYNYDTENGFSIDEKNSEDSLIDVKFPEPLMTFTLQKMSHLNDEDYELMSDNELKEAEADLSHFLLTDFPDSEIRRDTRMAFAAMKLCQLSKNIKPDFSLLDPSLNKNIEQARKRYYEENTKNVILENKKDKKKEEEIIWEYVIKLTDENKREEISKIEKRYNKIFQLLLKASYENPDKLKLWRRCVEFCYLTGIEGLSNIFSEIDKSGIHHLSKVYLKAYVNLIINESLLHAKTSLDNEYKTFWKTHTTMNFLKSVRSIEFWNNDIEFPFVVETIMNTIVVYQYCINNVILSNNDSNYFNFENYFWYLLTNVSSNEREKIWKENISHVRIESPISWSIYGLYPRLISLKLFDEIHEALKKDDIILEKFDFNNQSEGFLIEILEANNEIKSKYLSEYDKIDKILNRKNAAYIPLDIWVKELLLDSNKSKWIDPRLSEWSVLEIIKQISLSIIKRKDVDVNEIIFNDHYQDIFNIHPKNYLIPDSWLLNDREIVSWSKWKEIVNQHKIGLTEENELINDFRYIPLTKWWKTSGYGWLFGNGEFALIVGLSVLMLKLFSKSFEWPSSSNKLAFIDELYSRASYSMETEPISSNTRLLLAAVFSKREIEFLFGNKDIDYDDQIKIKNLSDFVGIIEKIQLDLETHQLSLINQAPRQLTYIDIDSLNSPKSIF